jgi:hypothetical protein
MKEPWEIFWEVCVRNGMTDGETRRRKGTFLGNCAAAIGMAAQETIKHLRNEREWTWVNSHILTGKLVDVATAWTARGGPDPAVLRAGLKTVWLEEEDVARHEELWRERTESILERKAKAPRSNEAVA